MCLKTRVYGIRVNICQENNFANVATMSESPVNRRGYDGQQKAQFVTPMDRIYRFEAH
jgi:hypothetical protein